MVFKSDLAFNICVGQIIAICLVSGGIFTQNIQNNLGLQLPVLQLMCMYLPLTFQLLFWVKSKNRRIKVFYFLICAIVDIHATLLIVYAYEFTSITSVMLLEDFTIPSAFILSICFLKIRYTKTHLKALFLCGLGMACSFCNDLFIK